MTAPTIADVRAASGRLNGTVRRTPLLEWPLLNERVGGRLLIKPENLQYTGSFKFRGATNFIGQLSAVERGRGVVAYSSGNHAQGVAAASRAFGVSATIVMPSDAPQIKLEKTRALGAEIIPYDRKREIREEIAATIAAESGATIVPPYDHAWTIAGQGTVGMEIAAQSAEQGLSLDAVIIPSGGGGLAAGCSLAIKDSSPRTEIWSAEPAHYDDHAKSLAAGTRVANSAEAPTSICDALLTPIPGEVTFNICQRLLTGGLAVSDAEVSTAMAALFSICKLVAEPGGAVGLAAALAGHYDCDGKTVAIVVSGGNVDPGIYSDAVARGSA